MVNVWEGHEWHIALLYYNAFLFDFLDFMLGKLAKHAAQKRNQWESCEVDNDVKADEF